MLKYVKNILDNGMCCQVAIGTDKQYYESHSFILKDVQQAYNGSWYLSNLVPVKPSILIKEELYELTYNKKSQIAYDGIYIIKDDISYKFQTSQDSITMCNSTVIRIQNLPDETTLNWKTWVDGQPAILVLTKTQFINIFSLGLNMVNEAFTVEGNLNAQIMQMTDQQLADETYINEFKEKVETEFAKIQTEFELDNI